MAKGGQHRPGSDEMAGISSGIGKAGSFWDPNDDDWASRTYMNVYDLLTLYDYNYWARDRILDAVANLSHHQISAPATLSYGSLLGNLIHILNAEWLWRLRCQEGVSPTAFLLEGKITNLDTLQRTWEAEEALMRAFLGGLQEEDLSKQIRYKRIKGQEGTNTLWHILLHIVNHGTQHRAEAAALLTEYDQSPGDIDFIIYLRNLDGS